MIRTTLKRKVILLARNFTQEKKTPESFVWNFTPKFVIAKGRAIFKIYGRFHMITTFHLMLHYWNSLLSLWKFGSRWRRRSVQNSVRRPKSCFCGVSHFAYRNELTVLQTRSQPIPSTHQPINNTLIILPLNAIQRRQKIHSLCSLCCDRSIPSSQATSTHRSIGCFP